jgi:hypothetical protein
MSHAQRPAAEQAIDQSRRQFAVRTLVRMASQRCDVSVADARNAESMAISAMEQGASAAMAVASTGKWLRSVQAAAH